MTSGKTINANSGIEKRPQKGVKAFLRRNCTPTLVDEIIKIREMKKAGLELPGERPYLRAVGKYLGRTALSAAIQFGSATTFGVLAWQQNTGAPSTNSLDNASPIANSFAMAVSGLVPPSQVETAANVMLATDYFLSGVRIAVEQMLWRKCKVTPDFPGTMVSPLVIGAAEMAYKTAAFAEMPDNAHARLAQGIKGVYGNLVRFAMVGVIALAAKAWDAYHKNQPKQLPAQQ